MLFEGIFKLLVCEFKDLQNDLKKICFMILQFDYLKKFKCTSHDCINTCCSGWDIHVDEKTFLKSKIQKTQKLKTFFLNKLKKSNNKNFAAEINTNKNKRCIFLDNKNLCEIQKKN